MLGINGLSDLSFKLLKMTYALETIIFAVLLIYQLFNIDNLHTRNRAYRYQCVHKNDINMPAIRQSDTRQEIQNKNYMF